MKCKTILASALLCLFFGTAGTLASAQTVTSSDAIKVEVFADHFVLNGETFKPPFPLSKLTRLIGEADRVTGQAYNHYWDRLGMHAFVVPTQTVEYVDFKLQDDWGFLGQIMPSPKKKFSGPIVFGDTDFRKIGNLEKIGFKGNCRPSEDKTFHIEVLQGESKDRLMLLLGSKATMGCTP